MLEKVFIFVIFLFPLVFFHELGHFLFARFFGVRVEVFSLGFGPKLFKFKRGDTEYCFSLIPLGGYVKMYGDDPMKMDEIPEEERKYSFTFKSKLARFWIVFGGPLANFIFTYFIFFFLLLVGEKVPEVRYGVVKPGTETYTQGIRTGDILYKVNGKRMINMTDIPMGKAKNVKSLTVVRLGKEVTLPMSFSGEALIQEMTESNALLRTAKLVDRNGKQFDILRYNQQNIEKISLDELAEMPLSSIELKFESESKNISLEGETREEIFSSLRLNGFAPSDLRVKSVKMNSAADKAGLKGNDVVLSLDGKPVFSFYQLRKVLNSIDKDTFKIKYWSQGQELEADITPETISEKGQKIKLIGIYSNGDWIPPRFVESPSKGLIGSTIVAFERTWDSIVKTFGGFKKLITNETSLKNIGGPLSIGQVAADSFKMSLSYFFSIMALISVNLGVINLFPIPVLDGGHIMFILLEIVNRGPLSRRKLEIAQQFGLSLLLLLTVAALYNDFSRLF